jgi:hypothetical protein
MWIVRVALDRPYTFIVLAILILVLSPVMILRTPTDIFPNIDIPVIAVAWQYTGMNPEDGKRSSRRQDLPATWREFRHRQCPGDGHIPNRPSTIAAGHPASLDHQLQRFERAHSAARTFWKWTLRTAVERPRTEFPEAPTGDRSWGRHSLLVRGQTTSGHD